jgi:mannosyltransferase
MRDDAVPPVAGTTTARCSWAWGTGLALVLGLATVLRVMQVHESLWLDELHTAWTVAEGLDAVCPRALIGNQSPLFFYVVWGAKQTLGLSELALRFPSLVAGVVLVLLVAWVTRRWTRSGSAALWAALLVSLDWNCLFYSQEARPYACLQLVGLCQLLAFWHLVTAPTGRRRLAFVALSWLLFYVHYTGALLLAAELVSYAVWSLRPAWRPACRPRQLLLDGAVWLLGCLPAVPHLVAIAARRANWTMFIPRQPLQAIWTMFPLNWYVLLPAAIGGAAWGLQRFGRGPAHSRRPAGPGAAAAGAPWTDPRLLVLLASWLFVPLFLAWASTALDVARLFFPRYLQVMAVAPIVMAAFCCAACPGWHSRAVCGCAVLAAVIWDGGLIAQYRYDGRVVGARTQDWRSAVATINAAAPYARLPVLVRSGLIEADALRTSRDERLRQYCLLPVTGIYRLARTPDDLLPLPTSGAGQLRAEVRRQVDAAGGAWCLLAGTEPDVAGIERELLSGWGTPDRRPRIELRESFGDVTLLRLRIAPQSDGPPY